MDIITFGALVRGITAGIQAHMGKMAGNMGINPGQFEYFMLIYLSPGINQTELAARKNVGKASVTKALYLLENKGYIIRMADRDDRRNIRCFVSEKGEQTAIALRPVSRDIEETLFGGMGDDDKAALDRCLHILSNNAGRMGT